MQAKLIIAPIRRLGLEQVLVVVTIDGRPVFRAVRWSEMAAMADVRRWARKAA